MLKEYTISVSKTVQPKQFEPLSITCTELHVVPESYSANDIRKERKARIAKLSLDIKKFIEGAAEEYRD